MQKYIAILLLHLLLVTNLELYQLVKLPVLFEHFKEHKAANRKLTFFDFLDLHYFSGHPKDADAARDMQLPFQKCHISQSGNYANYILPQIFLSFFNSNPVQEKVPAFSTEFIPHLYSARIFQPPR